MSVTRKGRWATRNAMQGTFCKLCDCWVPGERDDGIWHQHIHSQRHRRSQSTSNYRSAPSVPMTLPVGVAKHERIKGGHLSSLASLTAHYAGPL